jgi:hypothetical protein
MNGKTRISPSNASLHTCIADKRSQALALLGHFNPHCSLSKCLSSLGRDATLARAFGGLPATLRGYRMRAE